MSRDREMAEEARQLREQYLYLMEQADAAAQEAESFQEELKATNQELQSINEELRTSQEELQSTSEELVTVNAELEDRIRELSRASDDMANFLAATEIGLIFLDTDLRIMRFTPSAAAHVSMIAADVGRPLADLRCTLSLDNTLAADADRVLDTLTPLEREAATMDGSGWYLVRMLPYRAAGQVIGGVVIAFIDITGRRQAEEEMRRSKTFLDP